MAEMEKLQVSYNKTLKLSNVVIKELIPKDMENYFRTVELMENYIKSKGAQPIGPLIQYTAVDIDEGGVPNILSKLMRQTNNFIHKVEAPYLMEPVIRVPNCLYVRFTAEEKNLKFAYDKLNLISFEEDITLAGDSYTIFVDKNEDMLVADIFMEKAYSE
ncbi:hypothetical protein [Desulfotruncus arcticus]|nr:hypothetical protein [Desulfotruncus arcticus]